MKARKKGSNDEWKDVIYVQLEGSDILYKERYLEFDTISTEIKINEQIVDERHWQNVRERAAIAAMQGMLANQRIYGKNEDYVSRSVEIANSLVKQLRGE